MMRDRLRSNLSQHFLAPCALVASLAIGVAGSSACTRGTSSSAEPEANAREAAPAPPPSAAPAAEPTVPKPKPTIPYDVLLIGIDSLRADMPWAGYPRDIAPWLTAFQKRCVTYTQAYAISSYTAMAVPPALVGELPSTMERDGKFFTRYTDRGNLYVTERLQKAGHRTLTGQAHGYFLPILGSLQGFDDHRMIRGGVDIQEVTSVTSDRLTELAQQMLSVQENVVPGQGKRFLAYFHYMDPHHTYRRHEGHPTFGTTARDQYDHEVHYTDSWVGKLVDWVLEKPWSKNLAILFFSDHGEGFGEHGQYRHAYNLWESLVKVPLIACVPGAEPRQISTRRSLIDLAPTIAELMGVPPDPPFRGTSLVPEIFGEEVAPRRIVVDLPRCDLMDRRRAVIAEGFKIIAFGDDARFQLYNLDEDPKEERDLAAENPEKLAELKRIYEEESARAKTLPVLGGGDLKGAPKGRRY